MWEFEQCNRLANTHVHESAIHHYVTLDVGDKNRLNHRVSHDSPETREENAKHVAAFTGNSKNNSVWHILYTIESGIWIKRVSGCSSSAGTRF